MSNDIYIPREEAESKLLPILLARQAKNAAIKEDETNSEIVKQWFALEGEDELFDGEHGIIGYQKAVKRTTWDITRAPDEVILYMAREGLLDVKDRAFTERRTNKPSLLLDDAVSFRHEGETLQLRVEKKD